MHPPDEVFCADLVWSLENGQELAINRLWLQHHHTSGSQFEWQDGMDRVTAKILDAVQTSAPSGGNTILHWLSSKTHLTRVDAYSGWGSDGKATRRSLALPSGTVAGTNTGGSAPPQLAPIVQLWGSTGFVANGRRRRGRLFMPQIGATYIGDDGRLDQTTRDGIAASWGAFFNDVQGAHMDGGASIDADYCNVGVYSRADQAFYQLEDVSVSQDFGVQRRRINKLQRPVPNKVGIAHN
jgi:hypothetical protein